MEIPHLIRNHRTGRTDPRSALRRNTYLTDECRLYRCLGWDDSLVLLEDCVTLEAFAYPADELAATDIRLVKPAR